MPVCLSVSLSLLCMFVCMFLSLRIFRLVCKSDSLNLFGCLYLSVCLFLCLSVSLTFPLCFSLAQSLSIFSTHCMPLSLFYLFLAMFPSLFFLRCNLSQVKFFTFISPFRVVGCAFDASVEIRKLIKQ